MPIFLAALLGGLVTATGSIVGRVLISLGLGFVAYSGISVLLSWIQNEIFSGLLGVDPLILTVASLLQVDTAINILFSAVAIRLVLQGLNGGSITKAVWK